MNRRIVFLLALILAPVSTTTLGAQQSRLPGPVQIGIAQPGCSAAAKPNWFQRLFHRNPKSAVPIWAVSPQVPLDDGDGPDALRRRLEEIRRLELQAPPQPCSAARHQSPVVIN
jgi:hypothetical protein